MDACFIQNQVLRAEFRAQGAELRRLGVLNGPGLLWEGDPEVWGRTSPVLFPVVGRLAGNRTWVDGRAHTLSQHGFARDLPFRLLRLTREDCVWQLEDEPQTRPSYPFAFDLRIGYRLDGPCLQVRYEVRNPGDRPLPASLGAHPAFRWPLAGLPRETHRILFEQEEVAPVRRLRGGLLDGTPHPTPVEGRTLRLRDDHFRADALIFDRLRSRSLRYGAPGGPGLEIAWSGFPHLALWTVPGAGFLCIEPWHGHHSPEGFDGDLREKPGIFLVEPGRMRTFGWSVRVLNQF